MIAYTKPHLTYEQQLALILSRGATCSDATRAIRLLETIGYYNVTGYLYPYRQPGTSGQGRLDTFQPGTTIDDVAVLIGFDHALRACLLDGLQSVEVAIRARIAYVLGKRNPFGHLDPTSLDGRACAQVRSRATITKTAFDWWRDEYQRLQERARREPFVKHNLDKYGEPLPIWIACEFLDFGAVSNLYLLLTHADRQTIAETAGLPSERTLRSWLTSLNHVRNVCAHNQRLWNRTLTVKPTLRADALPSELRHLIACGNEKPYAAITITAYLLQHLNPSSAWTQTMRSVLDGFPPIPIRSIDEISAPSDWATQQVWLSPHTPAKGTP